MSEKTEDVVKEVNKVDPVVDLVLGDTTYKLELTMRAIRHMKEACGVNLLTTGFYEADPTKPEQELRGPDGKVVLGDDGKPIMVPASKTADWVSDPEQFLHVLRAMMIGYRDKHKNENIIVPSIDELENNIITPKNQVLAFGAMFQAFIAQSPVADMPISNLAAKSNESKANPTGPEGESETRSLNSGHTVQATSASAKKSSGKLTRLK